MSAEASSARHRHIRVHRNLRVQRMGEQAAFGVIQRDAVSSQEDSMPRINFTIGAPQIKGLNEAHIVRLCEMLIKLCKNSS